MNRNGNGARGMVRVHGGGAEIFSRHGTHLSTMFPEIVEALPAALGGRAAIVDGEIVALDHRARPSFSRLQRRLRSPRPRPPLLEAFPAALFVFDILHWHGHDVTGWPYAERRALLEDLGLGVAPPALLPPVWSDVTGDIMLDVAAEFGLEGVVAKRAASKYQPGRRSQAWLKTPLRRRAPVVIGGWVPSGHRADAVGSLLLGAHDDSGDLVYVGHVAWGFTERGRAEHPARGCRAGAAV